MSDEFTPDVLEQIVVAALKARDIEGVGHAMRLLAVRDPDRAELLLATLELGITLAEHRDTFGGIRPAAVIFDEVPHDD